MSLISPNFDVKSIFFFPILARGLFPKLLEKGPVLGNILCDLDPKVKGQMYFLVNVSPKPLDVATLNFVAV